MTLLIILFVLVGWGALHSGPGLFDTVARWFFFGFMVPVFLLVLISEGGKSVEDRREDFVVDRCRDAVNDEAYFRCAEDAR